MSKWKTFMRVTDYVCAVLAIFGGLYLIFSSWDAPMTHLTRGLIQFGASQGLLASAYRWMKGASK